MEMVKKQIGNWVWPATIAGLILFLCTLSATAGSEIATLPPVARNDGHDGQQMSRDCPKGASIVVMPVQAGIQTLVRQQLDSRLRGNDMGKSGFLDSPSTFCGRQMSTSAPLVPSGIQPGTPPLAVGSLDTDTTKPPKSPVILGADSTITHERQLPSGAPPIAVGSPKADTSIWHRPTGALFKSVLFPGWGQYSNGKYQKAAIIFGLESFFIFKSAQYFQKTRDRFDTFQQTQERSDFDAYDNARTTRNKYYWFVAGTIFISMWDAYADAHLKPFEEVRDDDEFWGLEPGDRSRVSPPPLSLALTIRY